MYQTARVHWREPVLLIDWLIIFKVVSEFSSNSLYSSTVIELRILLFLVFLRNCNLLKSKFLDYLTFCWSVIILMVYKSDSVTSQDFVWFCIITCPLLASINLFIIWAKKFLKYDWLKYRRKWYFSVTLVFNDKDYYMAGSVYRSVMCQYANLIGWAAGP